MVEIRRRRCEIVDAAPRAARALSTLSLGEPATLALRDPPGAADGLRTWAVDVEERLARLEERLAGIDWAY